MPRGQCLAIIGPSGSGKSTLLGLIAGLDAPSTGQILIDGIDITTLDEDALARLRGEKIGFVFQFFHLVPSLTALENILVPMEIAGRRDARTRAQTLLDEVGPARPRASLSVAAVGRRAAAHRDRAGAGQRSAADPRRRADRQSGHAPTGATSSICCCRSGSTRGVTLVLVTHDRVDRGDRRRAAGAARRPAGRRRDDGRGRREARDELRRRDDGARDARVVAAAAVLLHLPVDRRRRDRRDPVGDSERARRCSPAKRASLHQRRRDHHQQSARSTPKLTREDRRAPASAGATSHRVGRSGDDGARRGSRPGSDADGGAARRRAGLPVSTAS